MIVSKTTAQSILNDLNKDDWYIVKCDDISCGLQGFFATKDGEEVTVAWLTHKAEFDVNDFETTSPEEYYRHLCKSDAYLCDEPGAMVLGVIRFDTVTYKSSFVNISFFDVIDCEDVDLVEKIILRRNQLANRFATDFQHLL